MSTRTRTLPCLAVVLFAVAPPAFAQAVTTLAGSGTPGYVDGPGAFASFFNPSGVGVDASGTVYVADTGNLRIRRVSAAGVVTTFAGSGIGSYDASLNVPAVNAAFWGPLGVAVDDAGNVWVADSDDGFDGQWVKKITPDGILHNLQVYPGFNPVAVAPHGADLFVLDPYVGLWKVPAAGQAMAIAGPKKGAAGLAVDSAGNAYVADSDANRVMIVTAAGLVNTFAGSGRAGYADGTGAAASFRAPSGLAVDDVGNVYVADRDNHVIRRITADGVVTTFAGSGRVGSADGPALEASFHGPTGVALDCAGNLYVADRESQKIRKVTVPGGVGACGSTGSWTVPSMARVMGAHGSFWTSDLTLHNRGSAPVSGTLTFLGNGEHTRGRPEKEFTLQALESLTIPDVLSTAFGITDGFGAVQVLCSASRLIVRSRTSTKGPAGTVGDDVPGIPLSAFFTDRATEKPVLVGLAENDDFRSNLVLVNGAAVPITVLVTASDPSGAVLGEKTYALPALGMLQDSRFLLRPELGGRKTSSATVTVSSPTPGALFTALATVVDNTSNDPTTVLPQ